MSNRLGLKGSMHLFSFKFETFFDSDLDVFACFLPWSLLATGMLVFLVTEATGPSFITPQP